MKRSRKTVFLILGLALPEAFHPALAQSPNPFVRETLTCEDMRKHPTEIFSREIDLGSGSGSPTEVDYGCEESLEKRPFLQRLSKLAVAIRGAQRWPCEGTQVYALMRYQAFATLKAGFAPSLFLQQAEQAEAAAAPRRNEQKLRHFTAWSLESRTNFRLHQAYLSEYAKALPKLTEYYRRKFGFPEAKARNVAQHALMLYSDWAFGASPSRNPGETPSRLVELSMEKNSTVADLRAALAATPLPEQTQIDRALKVALLYNKPRPYLTLLIDQLETLNRGDESAIFFALENPDRVKLLLERGADADYANDFGKTPLFYAIELRQPGLVELLLDHGADVNHAYQRSVEPEWSFGLRAPASSARFKTNPCAYDLTGFQRTPLMHAAKRANVEILALLVRRGARVGDVDEGGYNALNYARTANAAFLRSLGLLPHQEVVGE